MKLNAVKLLVVLFLVSCNASEKKQLTSALYISEEKQSQQRQDLTTSMKRGQEIYSDFCASCHLPTGKGVAKVFPPLAKSDYLMNNRIESITSIKYGQSGEITVNGITYNGVMAPLGLDDGEVADVMNYITNSWGNSNTKLITEEEVSKIER